MSTHLWVIQCVDAPDSAQRRAEVLPEHLAYVKNCPVPIALAGPLTSKDGGRSAGSLLVLNDAPLAQVEAFVHNTPFSKAGVWGEVRISRLAAVTSRLTP